MGVVITDLHSPPPLASVGLIAYETAVSYPIRSLPRGSDPTYRHNPAKTATPRATSFAFPWEGRNGTHANFQGWVIPLTRPAGQIPAHWYLWVPPPAIFGQMPTINVP